MVSPLTIEIAIWYHTRSDYDYGAGIGDNNYDTPVVQSILKHFVELRLLTKDISNEITYAKRYYATEALKVWIEAICKTPFPVQKWIIPEQDNK